ncbi:hypothetical protein F66182_2210 [Fusarium sp. NRRL 66182]|nr:hypothetical protein F66182_2210 [Fusarium sp. NRRL 66182]
MLLSTLLAPFSSASALTLLLALADISDAAVQCDLITTHNCGKKARHKLPTGVGSTYFADGFHGGVINAKFESMKPSFPRSTTQFDLTYNFNLGSYDRAYWVILPNVGEGDSCYAVYKNCDVTIYYWPTKTPIPATYTLA